MKKLVHVAFIALAMASLLSISGCSTVEGFGKDVQKGGEGIERAADR